MEGTEEMDRAALLARLHADQHSKKEPVARDSSEAVAPMSRDTIQHAAIGEQTRPTEPVPSKFEPTQHYEVPNSLIAQSRAEALDDDDDDDLPTATFSMESMLEFDAMVDEHGRIALPQSALKGRFGRGAKIHIVAQIIED